MTQNIGIFFDTETTGLPDWKSPSGGENQPHIVQLAAHQVDLDSQQIIQSMDVIVKPDGWEIPVDVSEIHGITTEYANAVGIPEKMALDMFIAFLAGRPRIAHNSTFDNRIIRIGLKRYFGDRLADEFKEGAYECTGLLSKPIMKMEPKNRYGYKMPKLVEAYKHFTGKDLENAHTAIADVNACMDVYFAIKQLEANAA